MAGVTLEYVARDALREMQAMGGLASTEPRLSEAQAQEQRQDPGTRCRCGKPKWWPALPNRR